MEEKSHRVLLSTSKPLALDILELHITGVLENIRRKYHYMLAMFFYSSLGTCWQPLLETGYWVRRAVSMVICSLTLNENYSGVCCGWVIWPPAWPLSCSTAAVEAQERTKPSKEMKKL